MFGDLISLNSKLKAAKFRMIGVKQKDLTPEEYSASLRRTVERKTNMNGDIKAINDWAASEACQKITGTHPKREATATAVTPGVTEREWALGVLQRRARKVPSIPYGKEERQ